MIAKGKKLTLVSVRINKKTHSCFMYIAPNEKGKFVITCKDLMEAFPACKAPSRGVTFSAG